MKIINAKCHQQKFTTYFNIDIQKLHETKVKMGAINKDTSIEDSLIHDLMQLEIDVKNYIQDYFADYGKDIIIEEQE